MRPVALGPPPASSVAAALEYNYMLGLVLAYAFSSDLKMFGVRKEN